MAKRRLYGAALQAYNRKRGRGSTAIARRGRTQVVTRTRTRVVKVRGRRRRGGAVGAVRPLRAQLHDLMGSAGYGFLTGDHSHARDLRQYVAMVPTLDAIGAPASHGLLLHFIATKAGGSIRKIAGHLSHAALMHAAHNLGATGFDHEKAAKLAGDDGEIGDDDLADLAGDDDDEE